MIKISRDEIEIAYQLTRLIPEFEPHYSWDKWTERLAVKESICLTAYYNGQLAGMKLGYFDREVFYSWIGAVHPKFRRKGVGKALADALEQELQTTKCDVIRMKTRNKFLPMLLFSLSNGFKVVDAYRAQPEDISEDIRVVLEKKI